ncbi:MAG: hypothetical protein ACK5LK_06150, partial [Chthoniobacterales bacterium]
MEYVTITKEKGTCLNDRGIQMDFGDGRYDKSGLDREDASDYIFSFFSGCGFLDLGFDKSGYEIVLANEFIPDFAESHHFSRNRMRLPLPIEGYHQGSISEFFKGDAADKLSS